MKRLIYAEDAIESIRDEIKYKENRYATRVFRMAKRVIDSVPTVDQRCLQPVEEWISVKDRLPEANKPVLVCEVAYDSISIAYRLPDSEEFIDIMDGYPLDYATNWMPLPKPPKES